MAIELSAYNPEWPKLFSKEKGRITHAIGKWLVALEHIGSTSVPGMTAKPIIDMAGGVMTLDDVMRHCIQPLKTLGYQYVPEYEEQMPDRRYFVRGEDKSLRTHQLHIWVINTHEWNRHLALRDYLRTHPDACDAYSTMKQELAVHYDKTKDYCAAKFQFVQHLEKQALEDQRCKP